MMADPKKKLAMLIIEKKGKPVDDSLNEPTIEEDSSIGLESAAEDLISALERKDPKAVVACLKDFLEMASYEEEDQEDLED